MCLNKIKNLPRVRQRRSFQGLQSHGRGVSNMHTTSILLFPRRCWTGSPSNTRDEPQHDVAPDDDCPAICSVAPASPPPQHAHTTPCQPHELKPYQCGCRDNELQPPVWVHAPEQAAPSPALLLLVLGTTQDNMASEDDFAVLSPLKHFLSYSYLFNGCDNTQFIELILCWPLSIIWSILQLISSTWHYESRLCSLNIMYVILYMPNSVSTTFVYTYLNKLHGSYFIKWYFSVPFWLISGYIFFAIITHNNQAMCIYITLIPLPVSSVYTHLQEGYIQFKTLLHKMTW
jgi:hypothetical protein